VKRTNGLLRFPLPDGLWATKSGYFVWLFFANLTFFTKLTASWLNG
jgi:hypothetical protein